MVAMNVSFFRYIEADLNVLRSYDDAQVASLASALHDRLSALEAQKVAAADAAKAAAIANDTGKDTAPATVIPLAVVSSTAAVS